MAQPCPLNEEGDGASTEGFSGNELLYRIKTYIDEHLADPDPDPDLDLSPQCAARANRISVRHLHKLFEHESTTVG
ncbi:hypothetical protein [Streptomyces sp. NPDC002540]